MNSVNFIGRLTKDIEVKYQENESSLAIGKFTLAVNRVGKKDEADFIPCTVFGKQAENMEKFTKKGSQVGITGRLQAGKYEDKDKNTKYTINVICDRVEFLGSKPKNEENKDISSEDNIEDDDTPFA